MIEVSCYSCRSSQHKPYATENGYSLVKCTGCGLLYVNPRPSDEEIEEGVKIGAHGGEGTLYTTGRYMPDKVALYNKVLKNMYGAELQNRKATWLDIGCGHGELLMVLKALSKDSIAATGIEPNQHKAAAASKRGLDVTCFDLASSDQHWDSISLLNVYSHLTSPPEFLRMVRERLKPKGELLLQTGDTASLSLDQHPRPFLLPDHLSFASQQILSNMLKQTGFEIISVKKYPAVQLWQMKYMVLKEMVKVVLPHKRSQVNSVYSMFRVAKYRTDMWIRARAVA